MAGKSRRELKRSRSRDRKGDSGATTSVPSVKRPRIDLYVELRILLPNKMAGAIIGRKGENIRRLRQSFLANINLPTCKGPERILTITAELSVTCRILTDIIPTMSTELNGSFIDDSELRILLHTRQAGAVIGRRGITVKEIRERTDSKIKVFPERCPDSSDQVVQVRGTTRAIVRGIREILRTVESVHPPGVNRRYYDPNNFDSVSASKYGGYDRNETLTVRSQAKRTREKSPDPRRRSWLRRNASSSSPSTVADETASISSSSSSEPKPSSAAPASSTTAAPVSATDVPSLLSIASNADRRPLSESIWPLDVRAASAAASNPLRDFGSSVASVLQSNQSTRDCLDRLLSAVSCFVSSTMPPSVETPPGTYPVVNDYVSRTTLSVANDNDAPEKNHSVFKERSRKPVITSQIGIPRDLVGTVLGKGNCRLKFMETMTSTKIWTDDATDQSFNYVINITGSPEQIGCALELIQSVVKKQTHGTRQR